MTGEPTGTRPERMSSTLAPEEPPAIGGLQASSAAVTLSSGRRYELTAAPSGDRLVVRDRGGTVVLRIEVTDAGPVISFSAGNLASAPPPREAIVPPPSSNADGDVEEGAAAASYFRVPRATPVPALGPPSTASRATPIPALGPPSGVAPSQPDGGALAGAPASTALPGERGELSDSAFIADVPTRSRAPDPVQRRTQQPEGGARGQSLTLESYAVLCAEAAVGSDASFERALLRYGIADREAWKHLDQRWQDRLSREPILTLRWMELSARYREHLTRR